MLYAIKFQGEYMRERFGDDCFSDNLGNAILFATRAEAEAELIGDEVVVAIAEDDEGGIWEEDTEQ